VPVVLPLKLAVDLRVARRNEDIALRGITVAISSSWFTMALHGQDLSRVQGCSVKADIHWPVSGRDGGRLVLQVSGLVVDSDEATIRVATGKFAFTTAQHILV